MPDARGPVPVPIPYPNMAMHAMAAPFCPTILVMMMPALNMGRLIPMTLGDQPGVANPLFMQMGAFTMGNPKVAPGHAGHQPDLADDRQRR